MEIEKFVDFKAFYNRLRLHGLEVRRICDMSKAEVIELLTAAYCFSPQKCAWCPNFITDKAAKNGGGICKLDGRAIGDCTAFCSYPHDVVPF